MHFSLQSCLATATISAALLAKVSEAQYINQNCPILGPDFPAPKSPAQSKAIQKAKHQFPKTLEKVIAAGASQYGPFDGYNSSFSIGVFSTHDKESIFSYHYAAPGLNGSLTSGVLNDDTIYRLGSVSKLFTVYTYLIEVGTQGLKDPVTKYVPELAKAAKEGAKNPVNSVNWDEVTLEALASQMSGIYRDYSLQDLSSLGDIYVASGFPPLNASDTVDVPTCGLTFVGPTLEPCTREQYFQGVVAGHPVTQTFHTPSYSNVGFVILSYALENITGIPFTESFQKGLLDGVGISRTFYSTPSNSSNAIIPVSETASGWNSSSGDSATAGGYFSTTADMAAMGRAILNSTLLPANVTRRWLKPITHTSSLTASVGMPWEISRMELPITPGSNVTRVVDLYAKSGDFGTYSTIFVLVPDLDFGFSILTAGVTLPIDNANELGDLVATTWVAAFEAAAREEALASYVGNYVSTDPNLNSSITFALSSNRPGLGVTSFISNGTDMMTMYAAIAASNPAPNAVPSLRLYPMDLSTSSQISFRSTIEAMPEIKISKIFSQNCIDWAYLNSAIYGNVGIDEFVFGLDPKSGKAKTVSPKALRVTLKKQ